MKTSLLDFELPGALVPERPARERGASRLMLLKHDGAIEHLMYRDLPGLLGGDLCYFNNSKVRGRSLGRTQPVYASAQEEGSLAAPSAGLDITEAMLAELNHKFLTLHVGVEGFRPIDTENVEDFQVSVAERYKISDPPVDPVVCIGTTVVKALEAYALTGEAEGESKLFIRPPFSFANTKAILTNFHSPKNVHLAMVTAFAGVERVMEAYRVAIEKRYLFGAYGDAMMIL